MAVELRQVISGSAFPVGTIIDGIRDVPGQVVDGQGCHVVQSNPRVRLCKLFLGSGQARRIAGLRTPVHPCFIFALWIRR